MRKSNFTMIIRQITTILWYFAIPITNIFVSIIIYPIITSKFGAPGLAAFGLAQSIGGTCGIFCELGWGIVGPQLVSRSSPENRVNIYLESLSSRVVMLSIFGPISGILSFVSCGEFGVSSGLLSMSYTMLSLSPSWYLVGVNRPKSILWVETCPRVFLCIFACLLIYCGVPIGVYGILIGASVIYTLVRTAKIVGARLRFGDFNRQTIQTTITDHMPLTIGRMVSTSYTSLTIAIVNLADPSITASFTAIERLMRLSSNIVIAVPQRLQSWVGSAEGSVPIDRAVISLLLNFGTGLVSFIGFIIIAPVAIQFLFSRVAFVSFVDIVLIGFVLLIICISRGVGLLLVAYKKATWIAGSNVAAAVTGIFGMFIFTELFGLFGAILGELLAELCGLCVQAVICGVVQRKLLTSVSGESNLKRTG